MKETHPMIRGRRTALASLAAAALLAPVAARAQDTTAAPVPAPTGPAVLAWSAGPKLEAGRDHHVTFLTEGRGRRWLNVVGGNTYQARLADAWRAPVARDGSLGAWEPSTALPVARAGHSVVQAGRHVVLTGGQIGGRGNVPDVLTAPVNADGTLGAWSEQAPLPGGRFHHGSTEHRGWVYVTGGLETNTSTPTVFRARPGPDGRITKWDTLAPMPRPRSHHGAFVHDGALYLVAGLDGNPAGEQEPLKDVIRARILRDGSLGPWETVSTLPNAYGTHAAFARGGHVYLMGGVRDNREFVDVVLRAPFLRGGRIGAWEPVAASLPLARSHVHQTPVWGNFVYTVAGSNRRQVNGDAYVGRFLGNRE